MSAGIQQKVNQIHELNSACTNGKPFDNAVMHAYIAYGLSLPQAMHNDIATPAPWTQSAGRDRQRRASFLILLLVKCKCNSTATANPVSAARRSVEAGSSMCPRSGKRSTCRHELVAAGFAMAAGAEENVRQLERFQASSAGSQQRAAKSI